MRYLSLFLIVYFPVIVSYSQYKDSIPFPMEKSSLLWEISGPGVKKGCYLFGTMHLIEASNFIFPEKLEKLTGKSEVLVMELAGMPDQVEALNLIYLKEGTFFDFFTVEQSDSIIQWANLYLNLGEDAFRIVFNKMKPFALVQMATQIQFAGKTESYEMHFEEIARKERVEIIGLETMEEQMSIFDSLTNLQQSEMVMQIVRDPGKDKKEMKELQSLYTRQNMDSLYLFFLDKGGVMEPEQEKLLDNRNKKWLPGIEKLIREQKTLITVGAGHLGGPNGLIRLLLAEGYTLTPVEL